MIDEELVHPDAFALAVRARASYLARHADIETDSLRPFAQLTLLLGIELEDAAAALHQLGPRGAYRWALSIPV